VSKVFELARLGFWLLGGAEVWAIFCSPLRVIGYKLVAWPSQLAYLFIGLGLIGSALQIAGLVLVVRAVVSVGAATPNNALDRNGPAD
jgi:hypothetical protein